MEVPQQRLLADRHRFRQVGDAHVLGEALLQPELGVGGQRVVCQVVLRSLVQAGDVAQPARELGRGDVFHQPRQQLRVGSQTTAGDDLAMLNHRRAMVNADVRVSPAENRDQRPGDGGHATVQQTRLGEQEHCGTAGGDAGPAGMLLDQPLVQGC
ncbi:hypothetical protein D3C85_1392980 [compost metagenome]